MNILSNVKKNYFQLLFVFMAFLMMVLVSYYFVLKITNDEMKNYGNELMNTASVTISSMLSEGEVLLSSSYATAESMIKSGATNEEIIEILSEHYIKMKANNDRFDAIRGIYGFVRGEFINTSEFIPPDDYDPLSRPWYQAAINTPYGFAYSDPYVDVESSQVTVSISRVVHDPSGNIVGVLSIDIFTTSMAHYVSQLKVANDGYGILLNDTLDIVSCKDSRYLGQNITESNEIISKGYAEIGQKLEQDKYLSAQVFRDNNGVKNVAFFRKLFNGWYVGAITPLSSYNSKVNNMAIILSIMGLILTAILDYLLLTFSFQTSRSDVKSKMKSDFLANMSHEIRTPMNAISGMSELILRNEISREVREHTLNIKNACSTLLTIVNDILDFSKIDAGKLEITHMPFQIASVINDVSSMTIVRIGEKPIDFIIEIDTSLPCELMGDEVRLRQILVNLLNNAVKFTKSGHVQLKLWSEPAEDNDMRLFAEISDTGMGIKKEDLSKLFSSFTQVDTKRNRAVEGTGLGLAISKQLAEIMGGSIWCDSEYGLGTTFGFSIMVKSHDMRKIITINEPTEKNVLLLEENEILCQNMEKALCDMKVNHYATTDIQDFVSMLTPELTHIILPIRFYTKLSGKINNLSPNAINAVIISSEDIFDRAENVRVIHRPCHALNIATVLNNESSSDLMGVKDYDGIDFIAPKAKVLLVDDNDVNLAVAKGLLAPYKLNVTTANSAEMCFELLVHNQYDVIFMDHMMPVIDGVEATQLIRSYGGDYFKNVPIIALTANAISGARDMYIQNGFNDFISKPIEVKELNKLLYTYLPMKYIEKSATSIIYDGQSISDEILLTIYLDGQRKIPLLKTLFEERDIIHYTIEVHALKTVAASANNMELSNLAKSHEVAGKSGDFVYIEHNFPQLIEMYEQFINGFSYLAHMKNEETTERAALGQDEIDEYFDAIDRYSEDFDIDQIKEVINKLNATVLDVSQGKKLQRLIQAAQLFDYDAISEIIKDK